MKVQLRLTTKIGRAYQKDMSNIVIPLIEGEDPQAKQMRVLQETAHILAIPVTFVVEADLTEDEIAYLKDEKNPVDTKVYTKITPWQVPGGMPIDEIEIIIL